MHHYGQFLEGLSLTVNLYEGLVMWDDVQCILEKAKMQINICVCKIYFSLALVQNSFDNTYSNQKYWWTEILEIFDLIKGREKADWRYILPNAPSRPMAITSERLWRFADSLNHLCSFYYLRKQTDKICKNSWNASER